MYDGLKLALFVFLAVPSYGGSTKAYALLEPAVKKYEPQIDEAYVKAQAWFKEQALDKTAQARAKATEMFHKYKGELVKAASSAATDAAAPSTIDPAAVSTDATATTEDAKKAL